MIAAEFRDKHGIDVSRDPTVLQRLREACERAKIELDSKENTTIDIPFITLGSSGQPLHLRRNLSRAELEQATASLVERTVAPSRRCMSDARISPSDIGSVILVGGMTRMPRVREQARALFGRDPSTGVDPIEAVAKGAAIQGGVLSGEVQDILLLDVAPLSLGIETLGGAFSKLISRNTILPCRKTETFTTGVDGQTQVVLRVFQGERPLAEDNQFLGEFTLVGIPPASRGKAQIAVTFDIDANGLVSVSAVDNASGQAHSIAIEPCGGLSPAQIEWMVQESQRNAQADKEKKQRLEMVAAAVMVANDIAHNLATFANQLPVDSVARIRNLVEVRAQGWGGGNGYVNFVLIDFSLQYALIFLPFSPCLFFSNCGL